VEKYLEKCGRHFDINKRKIIHHGDNDLKARNSSQIIECISLTAGVTNIVPVGTRSPADVF